MSLFRTKTAAISLVILGLMILTACTSSKITSNKANGFNQKLTKLYLVIKSGSGANEFSYTFKTTFLRALTAKGVAAAYHIVDPLSLESEKQLQAKIEKYNPQFLMTITQTESMANSGYSIGSAVNLSGGVFDIKIFLPGSDSPVWRGSLTATSDTRIETAVDKAVRKLVEQLELDGLL